MLKILDRVDMVPVVSVMGIGSEGHSLYGLVMPLLLTLLSLWAGLGVACNKGKCYCNYIMFFCTKCSNCITKLC